MPSGRSAVLALFVTGHSLLGTYSQTASGNPLPRADPRVGAGARRCRRACGRPDPVSRRRRVGGLEPLPHRSGRGARLRVADRDHGRRPHRRGGVVRPPIRRRTPTRALSLLHHAALALRVRGRALGAAPPTLVAARPAVDPRISASGTRRSRRTRSSTSTHRRRCSTTGCSRRCTALEAFESRSCSLRS